MSVLLIWAIQSEMATRLITIPPHGLIPSAGPNNMRSGVAQRQPHPLLPRYFGQITIYSRLCDRNKFNTLQNARYSPSR
jgi:hypothetical protein